MLKPYLFYTLMRIAEASIQEPRITANDLVKRLNVPQQTLSRHIRQLEELNLVERYKVSGKELIRVTPEGLGELNHVKELLERVLKPPVSEINVTGRVFSGLGEGAYYLSQPRYVTQFLEAVGFKPYPGTLNVKVLSCDLKKIITLKSLPAIPIKGFFNGKRSFGPVKCYRAALNGKVNCAVILAERSHYGGDVLEVIAPINLRKTLNLKDGVLVSIKVFPTR